MACRAATANALEEKERCKNISPGHFIFLGFRFVAWTCSSCDRNDAARIETGSNKLSPDILYLISGLLTTGFVETITSSPVSQQKTGATKLGLEGS